MQLILYRGIDFDFFTVQEKMRKYLIILPVIPHYRYRFYKRIIEKFSEIEILAGKNQCIGPSSVKEAKNIASLNHDVICLMSHKIMWQKNISIPKKFGKGDVVVLSGNPRILSNYLVILSAKFRGIKTIWLGQGWTAGSNKIRHLIKRAVMSLCDSVILYTEKESENTKLFLFGQKKKYFLNNTVDTDRIFSVKNKIDTNMLQVFKNKTHLNDTKVILFVGRLEGKEKLNLLLDSFVNVCSIYKKVVLVVVGDGSYLLQYKTYAIKKNINNKIRWIGGVHDEETLAYWFLSADFFVYPGAIGLSLLHAFTYGLPVVTHNNLDNHMPEIAALEDKRNGLLFKENDESDLTSKIVSLLMNDNIRNDLSVNALKIVTEKYTFEQMVFRFVNALNEA